jgi:hypothetical protein
MRDERRQVPPLAPGGAAATQGPRVQRLRRLHALEQTAAKLYEGLLVYFEY